jgi:hypothetical protein
MQSRFLDEVRDYLTGLQGDTFSGGRYQATLSAISDFKKLEETAEIVALRVLKEMSQEVYDIAQEQRRVDRHRGYLGNDTFRVLSLLANYSKGVESVKTAGRISHVNFSGVLQNVFGEKATSDDSKLRRYRTTDGEKSLAERCGYGLGLLEGGADC